MSVECFEAVVILCSLLKENRDIKKIFSVMTPLDGNQFLSTRANLLVMVRMTFVTALYCCTDLDVS